MLLNIFVCIACVQTVAVGRVSGKSLSVQPHHPAPFHLAHQAPFIARPESRHPIAPQHPHGHLPIPFRPSGGSHGDRGRRREAVHECSLCPSDIGPCTCRCLNDSAVIFCGPHLSSCSQLTEVMSLASYPVDAYLRLEVIDTNLGCILEKDLWGSLVFQEIVITNNLFKSVDNLAFQPFSATLTTLNLDGNSLQNVYFPTMSDTPLLRSLRLSNNFVQFLPGYSAIKLKLLEDFNASYNKIQVVNSETFAGMPRLRNIDLSHNLITKVYTWAFKIPHYEAASLTINLSNNRISSIESELLDGVPACSIDLRNNHLKFLPEDVYRPIIDFTAASAFFFTNDNPFNCDTNFCWIATNDTVNRSFNTVLCPNLNNDPVEVLSPMCTVASNVTEKQGQRSERRPKILPFLLPPRAFLRRDNASAETSQQFVSASLNDAHSNL